MAKDNTTFDYKPDDEISEASSTAAPAKFKWTSSEYIGHTRGPGWYILLTLATLGISAAIYLLTRSYFPTGIILAIGIIVGFFAGRAPNEVTYEINDEALKIGEKSYPFRQFKSFSINRTDKLTSINFMPIKRFAPPISAFFETSEEAKVIDALGDSLPFEERKPDSIDRIAHKLKL